MGESRRLRPHRFRRRLTAAFLLVAAVSSGALAVLTYAVTSEYRQRSFESMSHDEVQIALALAPTELDDQSFERMQSAYEKRSGTDTVAFLGGRTYTSARTLTRADVPDEVVSGPADELATARTRREGHDYLVVGGDGPDGARYVFFFAMDQLEDSLEELRTVLVVGWVLVVALAAAVGHLIARRTLRPVRDAAEAATAIAGGLLDTRLPSVGEDEFRAWADSFNDMADALGAKIDELRRAAARQRQFTADVAHDLRTPLTGMAVSAELLQKQMDDLPEPSRRAATVLVRDVQRLRELVLDLLELSRLDAAADPVRPETLDVAAAIETTLDSVPLPPGVGVTVSVEDGLAVHAERGRFRRIVANIVGNSAVHGGARISVDAVRDGDAVAIRIHDDGPGIAPDRAERVFDRFYKSDASRAQGGSGLGLAIAREHARAMGGDVELDGGPGRGATFTVRLPAAAPDREGEAPAVVTHL
ncbi:HAMP domain-containing histidine kinase [Iamia sp. SCSIO 61187]|uniref:HAMP domain-containing sensor histidine kinase n=1 Tax=Iamia sp. SCSIO 61187 TaxID=2722752 RepID=UPI001C6281B9|nr:HAMP domain-containing sensor histidine kinase [Iamia sp. SCSIO 61187]QYG92484.1 HAMP domain-containing histidine kinase [Iamia sp. SCSIO 61187]